MNATRIGKIARLPQAVRDELNRRLQNGESGTSLCMWLHTLPEVHAVLRTEFAGRPINAQNLTEWRQGGFRDWQAEQEARLLAKELGQEMLSEPEAGHKVSTEMLALWLTTRYAVATRQVERTTDPKEHWRLLREMCHDVVRLRQGELSSQRLALENRWRDLSDRKDEKDNARVSAERGEELRSPGEQLKPVRDGEIPQRKKVLPANHADHANERPSDSDHSPDPRAPFSPSLGKCPASAPSRPAAINKASERSASVPSPGSDPTTAPHLSPTEIPPLRPDGPRVFQTVSNRFKPLKIPGTPQAPLAGPIWTPACPEPGHNDSSLPPDFF